MTLVEINSLLKATGYPVAYSHFEEDVQTPFITYLAGPSSNFFADNRVYQKGNVINIELYTDKKDLAAERELEELLDDNELPYETSETWIESEKLFQKIYEVSI